MSGLASLAAIGGGQALGQVASGVGAVWSANRASRNARHAHRRYLEWYGSRYQRTVKDLRAAGLNPLLAVKGGMAGGSMPSAQAGAGPPNPGQGASKAGADAGRATARMGAELELLASQADAARSQARSAQESARLTELDRRLKEIENSYKLSEQGMSHARSVQQLSMGTDELANLPGLFPLVGRTVRDFLASYGPGASFRHGTVPNNVLMQIRDALKSPGGVSSLYDRLNTPGAPPKKGTRKVPQSMKARAARNAAAARKRRKKKRKNK